MMNIGGGSHFALGGEVEVCEYYTYNWVAS